MGYRHPIPTWSILQGKPYVTVSAKGIANGLSTIINDGADFGVDTVGTTTSGIQEANDYLNSLINPDFGSSNVPYMGTMYILAGFFNISTTINISRYVNISGIFSSPNGTGGRLLFTGNAQLILGSSTNSWYGSMENIFISFYGSTTSVNIIVYNGAYIRNCVLYGNNQTGNPNYLNSTLLEINNSAGLVIDSCVLGFAGGTNGTLWFTNGSNVNFVSNCVFDTFTGYEVVFDDTTSSNLITNCHFGDDSQSQAIAVILDNGLGNMVTGNFHSSGSNTEYAVILGTTSKSCIYTVFIMGSGNTTTKSNGVWDKGNGNIVTITQNGLSGYILNIDTGSNTGGKYYLNNGNYIGTTPIINTSGIGYIDAPLNALPSLVIGVNPPISSTVYQNTNPYDIEIDLPVYATTSGTAGYVTIAKGATSTPTAIGNQFVNGSTSSTSTDIIKLVVPVGWYYEFTSSGVTFGTASIFSV